MKRKQYKIMGVILIFLSVFILSSCDKYKFESETMINPKFDFLDGSLAVQYQLGNLMVLDEWEDLNVAQILFLTNDDKKEVKLRVVAGDFGPSVKFYYTIGNIEVQTEPVKWKTIFRVVDSLPNVKWLVQDNKIIEHKELEKEKEKTKQGSSKKI